MRNQLLPYSLRLLSLLMLTIAGSNAAAQDKNIYDQYPMTPLYTGQDTADTCRGTWTFETYGFCEDDNHPWDQQRSKLQTTGTCAEGERQYYPASCQAKSHPKIKQSTISSEEMVVKRDSVAAAYLAGSDMCRDFESQQEKNFVNSFEPDSVKRPFLEIGRVKTITIRIEKHRKTPKYVFYCQVQPLKYQELYDAENCGPDTSEPKACYVLTNHQNLSTAFCSGKVPNESHTSYEPGMAKSNLVWGVQNDNKAVVPGSFSCNTGDHLPITTNDQIQAKFDFLYSSLEKDKIDKKLSFEDATIIKRSVEGLAKDQSQALTQTQRDAAQKMIETALSGKITLTGKANYAKFSSKGNVLATVDTVRGTLTVWDIATRKGTPIKASTSEKSFDISSAGNLLAYSTDTEIIIYDLKTKSAIRSLSGYGKSQIVKFASDSKSIVAAHDRTIVKWDVNTGKALNVKTKAYKTDPASGAVIELDLQYINDLQLTPNDENLLIGNRDADQVIIMSYPDWEELSDFRYYDRFALSSNGEVLAAQRYSVATISNISSGSLSTINTFDNVQYGIADLAVSPDGKIVAVGGFDGSLRLLQDSMSFTNPSVLQNTTVENGNPLAIDKILFSADGRYLIASGVNSEKRKVWIYNISESKIVRTIDASAQAGGIAINPKAIAVGVDVFSTEVYLLP